MARRVLIRDFFKKPISSIAGIDMAFLDDISIIAHVIVDYDSLEVKIKKTCKARLDFPYLPTFLSFREGPPIISVIKSIEPKPDIFFINAQGIAHPMLCGCASHVGVLANVPTIGVTTRKLCGEYDHKPKRVGEYAPVYYSKRIVGWTLKSKEGCNPIFVSPGHLVSMTSSIDITLKCIMNHKLPEPLYLAHRTANKEKKRISNRN